MDSHSNQLLAKYLGVKCPVADKIRNSPNKEPYNRCIPIALKNLKMTYVPYCSDSVKDLHWGCAWRAIQMVLSSIYGVFPTFSRLFSFFGQRNVLLDIYASLKNQDVKDIPEYLLMAKFAPQEIPSGWAEPFICYLVLGFYQVQSDLFVVNGVPASNAPKEVFEKQVDFKGFCDLLISQFETCASAVMIDDGTYAMAVFGIQQMEAGGYILHIADPHIYENHSDQQNGLYQVELDKDGNQVSNSVVHKEAYVYASSYGGVEFGKKKWMCCRAIHNQGQKTVPWLVQID